MNRRRNIFKGRLKTLGVFLLGTSFLTPIHGNAETYVEADISEENIIESLELEEEEIEQIEIIEETIVEEDQSETQETKDINNEDVLEEAVSEEDILKVEPVENNTEIENTFEKEKPNEEVLNIELSYGFYSIPDFSNLTRKEFIEKISEYAVQVSRENNLYASVIVAQAALETNYGRSGLSKAPNYNIFGIKGKYNGQSAYMQTQEDDGKGNLSTIKTHFKRYPSYMESLEDYAYLIRNGVSWNREIYKGTWKNHSDNYTDATAALTGVYATDTSYYSKLNKIIEIYSLYELDGEMLITTPTLPNGKKPVKPSTSDKNEADGAIIHTVVSGDSVSRIAAKYKTTSANIAKWNSLTNINFISVGQKLIVGYGGESLDGLGWIQEGSNWYYKDSNGIKQTGWLKLHNNWYYLNAKGIRLTGWIEGSNSTWYYMSPNGVMQTGWLKLHNNWYYLNAKGIRLTGWIEGSNSTWYYMSPSGVMQTGWLQLHNNRYYLNAKGIRLTGWIEGSNNTWYYMNPSGVMQTGWLQLHNNRYYLNAKGIRLTGWIEGSNNTWYYMNPSGVMQTGWIQLHNNRYYLNAKGIRLTGWIEGSNNTWYYMNKNGVLQTS